MTKKGRDGGRKTHIRRSFKKDAGQQNNEVSSMKSVYNLEMGEIETAMRMASTNNIRLEGVKEPAPKGQQQQRQSGITVIPTLPEYRYIHTCERCGCHVVSRLLFAGGTPLKCCANCGQEE